MHTSDRIRQEAKTTLRRQLLQSHLRVAGLAAIALLLVVISMQFLKKPITEIRLVNVPSANAASLAQLGLQRSEASLRGWVALKQPEYRQNVEIAWDDAIYPAFKSIRALSESDTEARQSTLSALDKKLSRLKKLQDWTIDVSAKPGNEPARLVFSEEFGPARKSLVEVIFEYRAALERTGATNSESFFKLRLALSEAEAALGRFVVEGYTIDASVYKQQMEVVRNQLDTLHVKLPDKVLNQLEVLDRLSESIIESRRSPRSNVAWHTISTRVAPLSAEIADDLASIAEHEISTVRNQVDQIARWSNTLSIWSIVALLLVVAVALILSNTESSRISAPVRLLFHATEAMKHGDYSQRLRPEGGHEVRGLIEAFNSMRESISKSHQQLEEMAYIDELTGLGNRKSFNNAISAVQAAEHDADLLTGVMMIDLDRFKQINDSHGHDVGDKLLTEFSGRLTRCLRPDDIACRLGGDEFAVLLGPLSDQAEAQALLPLIFETTTQPITHGGETLLPSATIGVAIEPIRDFSPSDIMKKADLALYDAKATGRGRYCFYSSKIHNKAEKSRRLAELIEHHDPDEIFRLVYQPYVDLQTGQTIGTEALLRCTHSECAGVPILDIITMLERNGYIDSITQWVMRQALGQLSIWQSTLKVSSEFGMSVNLSASLLRDKSFVESILEIVKESGVSGSSLTIELTETTVMEDNIAAKETINKLNQTGIVFAMDDFGTGYSSLVRLKEMPLSVLKIDQTFVKSMTDSSNDAAIVDASVRLGQAIGMLVTAEGIETAEQAEKLKELGCNRGQGYYYSYPMPPDELNLNPGFEQAA